MSKAMVLGCFLTLACYTQAQERPAPTKQIDAATIAAYEKLGAVHGGSRLTNYGSFEFIAGKEAAAKSLPVFRFNRLPKGKLPPVAVPFGLILRDLTDAGLKELAGLKYLSTLDIGTTGVTDMGLKELAGLKNLSSLDLSSTKVTDMGLKELAALKNLSSLNLAFTKVTDTGVKELAGLENLSSLGLGRTQVTGVGLKELAGLKNLTSLDLTFTKVTDVGLKELAGLKNLSSLDLIGTKVTKAGVVMLEKALPRCHIISPK